MSSANDANAPMQITQRQILTMVDAIQEGARKDLVTGKEGEGVQSVWVDMFAMAVLRRLRIALAAHAAGTPLTSAELGDSGNQQE